MRLSAHKNLSYFFTAFIVIFIVFCLDQGNFLSLPKSLLIDFFDPIISYQNVAIYRLTKPFKALIEASEKQEKILKIKEENLALISLQSEVKKLEKENQTLREALGINKRQRMNLVFAKIISRHPEGGREAIMIDAGKRDGIKINQSVVIPPDFLAGKVIEVFENNAKAILISDVNFSAGGKSENSRIEAIVRGSLDHLEMELIPDEERLKIGEKILTSGLDDVFPQGLLLGKISKISKEPAKTTKIGRIELFIDLAQIEDVFIINFE